MVKGDLCFTELLSLVAHFLKDHIYNHVYIQWTGIHFPDGICYNYIDYILPFFSWSGGDVYIKYDVISGILTGSGSIYINVLPPELRLLRSKLKTQGVKVNLFETGRFQFPNISNVQCS